MSLDLTIVISLLALFATFYQLYLQRSHNEKSVRPFGQIDLEDRKGHMAVWISNNGLGPMILDELRFYKNGKTYEAIKDCLELDARSYTSISVGDSVQKIILPNAQLIVFETRVYEDKINEVREQLALITVEARFRDIYDNRSSINRDLKWFLRHIFNEIQPS
ncbi:hypothetical protein BWI96_10345 [Siphonobacter sp. SORGH_AS_0500]|uniref:hypothetical protein n=1 Tax=Siphonobacter sp. SORGH_AS_0500 TaxID=1864824 RepID=UPI000CC7F7D1|nr:hypothetical protein [Siphonobacter sp. SORGH_AS_0500]PKK36763.1 hypothetical protein BWI96_10345 [Siphonobacter sp. SORGH_AS_0500]